MTQIPSPQQLKAWFDANPDRYKDRPEPDGYNSTKRLARELVRQPMVPNPEPRMNVPKPMDLDALYTVLDDGEVQAIATEGFGLIQEAVEAGDRPRVKRLMSIACRKGWLDQAKHDVIVNQINAVVPDPGWPAEVPGESDLQKQWPERRTRGMHLKYIDQVLGRVT